MQTDLNGITLDYQTIGTGHPIQMLNAPAVAAICAETGPDLDAARAGR